MTNTTAPQEDWLTRDCHFLTVRLAQLTGLPPIILHNLNVRSNFSFIHEDGEPVHSGVLLPDGMILDAGGPRRPDEIAENYRNPGDRLLWRTDTRPDIADIMAILPGTPDEIRATLRAAGVKAREIAMNLSGLSGDPEPVAEARRIAIARGERAARILRWSETRLAAYRAEVATRPAVIGPQDEYLDPAAFGMTDEDAFSPLFEKDMSTAQRAAIGRWDGAHALRSWCRPDPDPVNPEHLEAFASIYLDKHEVEMTDPDEFRQETVPLEELRDAYKGDPEKWIRLEHRYALEDGRAGYVDLLVEKIQQPSVFRRYEDGSMDIADGWHRTAAALAMGDVSAEAVIVPLPGIAPHLDQEDDVPEP